MRAGVVVAAVAGAVVIEVDGDAVSGPSPQAVKATRLVAASALNARDLGATAPVCALGAGHELGPRIALLVG